MELTLKEAIKEGYTKYGYADQEEQYARNLHEGLFKEVREEDWKYLVLFDKSTYYPSTSADELSTLISDYIGDNDSEECQRENEDVYNTVAGIDYTAIVETINKALQEHGYFELTDIKLVR